MGGDLTEDESIDSEMESIDDIPWVLDRMIVQYFQSIIGTLRRTFQFKLIVEGQVRERLTLMMMAMVMVMASL